MGKVETAITKWVTARFEAEGAETFKIAGGRFQKAGFPDLVVFLRGGTALWIEIKTASGQYSEIQKRRMADLGIRGHLAFGLRCLRDEGFDSAWWEISVFRRIGKSASFRETIVRICSAEVGGATLVDEVRDLFK